MMDPSFQNRCGIRIVLAALLALAGTLGLAGEARTQNLDSDRAALVALYNATDGENWEDNDNWLSDEPVDDWYGVTVTDGRVMRLNLSNNQLTGSIPPELGNLSSLGGLRLNLNQLTGSIPPELGDLASLEELWLNNNQLTGAIPPELGNLSSLEVLYLYGNQLTGSIPPELGNLHSLEVLYLSGNQLTGSIPPELGNLHSLERLALSGNQLTGSIPPELGDLASLEELYLHSNQLTGTIPPELGNLSSLEVLYLYNNQLTGSIPPELGKLSNLNSLWLDTNQLTGTIPSELGDLSSLVGLSLVGNQLTGTIPPELGDLSSLVGLYLRDNQLTGSIPPELGNLSSLKYLWLDSNQLTGSIPPELGSLSSLGVLDLDNNQLTGAIPPELGNLSSLGWLLLRGNQLTGAIPPELGNLSSLGWLDLSSNQLTGSIPPELGKLDSLQSLTLTGNQLTGSIPQSFTALGALHHFYFNLNPGLCAQDDAAIRAWLDGVNNVRGPDCSPAVRLSVNPSRLVEGAGATDVTVTAMQTAAGSATRVTLRLGGSAKEGAGQDYTLGGTRGLTIPANRASGTATLTFTPLADNLNEGNENIILEAEVGGKTEGSAILTLSDSDGPTPSKPMPTLFVPVLLTSSGRNNAFFTSEMTLTNRGSESATLSYTYTAHIGGGSGTASDSLAAGRQKIVPDAIGYLKSRGVPIPAAGNRIGTLQVSVSGSSRVGVTVRTTTAVPEGRAGLAYPGIAAEAGFEEAVYLCGLRQNEKDRSNAAFQNMGTAEAGPITLRTTVFPGDPDDSSPRVLPDVTLASGGFHQYSEVLGNVSNGYVKVERVQGTAPFYAYGVINDQANSDGSFVFPVAASSLMGTTGQTLPVLVETGGFASELMVTNFSGAARTVRFSFVAEAIGTADRTARFSRTLAAGEQQIIPDIVGELRRSGVAGVGPSGAYAGALFASAAGGDLSGVVIGARTGSAGGGGQYSVFYNAVPYGAAFTGSAWVEALQQNEQNRSNLALVNTGEVDDSPSVFRLDIHDGETGRLANTVTGIRVPARGWRQFNGILGQYAPGTTQGYVRITKTSGKNPFLAYGVINDGGAPGQRSGDGAYLPARQ